MRTTFIVMLMVVAPVRADESPATAYLKGLEALEKADWSGAAAHFGRAVEADDEKPDFLTARGVAYTLAEKFPQAIKDLERSLKLRADHKETRVWLGAALRMNGDTAKAPQHFVHGRDLSVDYASFVYNEMAWNYWRIKGTPKAPGNATAAFPKAARWFASRAKNGAAPNVDIAVDQFKQALERMDRMEYALAANDFHSILAKKPDEPTVLLQLAWCQLHLNDAASARATFTRLLTVNTRHADAYKGRAMANARLGRVAKAEADLDRAIECDAAEKDSAEALRKSVKAIAGTLPTESPAELLADLYAAARDGADTPDLVEKASAVRLAANARRLAADEEYQDRLRSLEAGLKELPDNPYSHVALAEFLIDHASVPVHRVEPRGPGFSLRRGNPAAELARARQFVESALKLDAELPLALRFKVALLIDANDTTAAGDLLAKLAPEIIAADADLAVLNHVVAGAQARALRQKAHKKRNPEFGDAGEFDLEDAAKFEKQAAEIVTAAADLVDKGAAATDEKTAEGQFARSQRLFIKGDAAGARICLEKALELKPDFRRALTQLAKLSQQAKQPAEECEMISRSTNVLHTTAAVWLERSWADIAATRWTTARATLDRAERDDPADARVSAYRAMVALGAEKPDEAIAMLRAALALEEARAKLSGTSQAIDAKDPRSPSDVGLSVVIRLRLGELLLAAKKPEAALGEYRANVAVLARVAGDGTDHVFTSMLPNPSQELQEIPPADSVAGLAAMSRLGAGRSLVALGKQAEAMREFEAVRMLAGRTQFFAKPFDRNSLHQEPQRNLHDFKAEASLDLARLALDAGDLVRARNYMNDGASAQRKLEERRKALDEEWRRRRRGGQ